MTILCGVAFDNSTRIVPIYKEARSAAGHSLLLSLVHRTYYERLLCLSEWYEMNWQRP